MEFIKKIKSFFEAKPEDYTGSALLIRQLTTDLRAANERVRELERLIRENTEKQTNMIYVAGFDDLSHEPTDAAERKKYAAQVSEFYEDVLKAKIRTSIAEIREMLAAVGTGVGLPNNMTRSEYDFLLRGMEAGLWKIHDWAIILQGELKNK